MAGKFPKNRVVVGQRGKAAALIGWVREIVLIQIDFRIVLGYAEKAISGRRYLGAVKSGGFLIGLGKLLIHAFGRPVIFGKGAASAFSAPGGIKDQTVFLAFHFADNAV